MPMPTAMFCLMTLYSIKRHSFAIDLVRRHYSGNVKRVIKGIGVVTGVYVNPNTDQFWIIDHRIYAPEGDGKRKLDHVRERLLNIVHHKQLSLHAVLMDSWYNAKQLFLLIESSNKTYYSLKTNRQVDDSDGRQPYQRVDSLNLCSAEEETGKVIKLRGFPKEHKVKLFRVVASTRRTDYIVTNGMTQESTSATQEACRHR